MTELFATTGESVAHIVQQGDVWNVELLLKDGRTQCLALDRHHAGTLYVGTHGKGAWKSSDNGQSWRDMELPQEDVFSMAVSPVDGAVYAGCEPSMLFRSEDGGQSWQELSALRSIPSAPAWSFPPRPWTSHVRWIATNPYDAALLIVGIESGGLNALVSVPGQLFAGLNDGRIYVSHDLGDSWQSLTLTGESLASILAMAYVG